jgi:ATP-binding cassette subfamily C (CFTR/MRP) protein 4
LGAVVFVSILNPWSLIPAALAAAWMLVVRSYFAQSSRDLKRLEGTSRSPIFSHLTSMIQGLQVIRSYRAEDTCLKEFSSHLNKNTRVKYSFIATIQWAGIRFDWISLSFIVLVTSFAMLFHATDDNFSAINIALTLTYSLNLVGLFQWTIR